MKSSDSLLAELRSRGLTLTVRGGRLLVGPAGLLTDELRRAIRENRHSHHLGRPIRELLRFSQVRASPQVSALVLCAGSG